MVLLALGAFNVSVKYLFKPRGRRTWHYRRHVPSSVKAHYDQPHILKSLQTEDDVEAAKICNEPLQRITYLSRVCGIALVFARE